MNLTNLLSKSQNRQLQLLEYLSKYESVSQKMILEDLEYNEKTLITDIHTINDCISPLSVHNQPYLGIRLIIPANYNFDYIYNCFLSSSNEYALIETIFFDETHSLSSLSDRLYLSISTVRRLILKINTELEHSEMTVSSQPLSLVGNEKKIYGFMTSYFLERFSPTDPFFESPPFDCIEKIIRTLAKNNDVPLDYPDLNRAKVNIYTVLTRLKNGNFPTNALDIPPRFDLSITNDSSMVHSFATHFNLPLNKKILSYMFPFLLIQNYALNFSILQSLASQNPKINHKLSIIEHMLILLSDEFNLPLENKEEVILQMYNATLQLFSNSFILNNRNKIFVDSITRYNRPFLLILNRELAKLFKKKAMKESDMYALAYCLTTHWPQLSVKLQSLQKKPRIGLFFYTDTEHTKYIKDEVMYYFRDKLTVDLMPEMSLMEFKHNAYNYDIVITNIYGLELENVRIISFPFVPSIQDYKVLEETIEKINKKK